MNLDDRANRAANSLRDHVTHDLDVGAAQRSLAGAGVRRRRDLRKARVATAALAVLTVGGGFALFSGGGPGSDRVTDERVDGERTRIDADQAILEALPQSPIDGKESWRLPVIAKPQSGVHEGDTITIYGRGFEPNDSLGIVHCTSEADTENAGVAACDLGSNGGFENVQYASAASDGTLVAEIKVRRFITTPDGDNVDCASAAERCLIGVGAINNYDRSGGSYINFADAPPFPEPTVTVTPEGLLVPGQEVGVQVSGYMPKRPVLLQQCIADVCEDLLSGKATADGTFATTVVVNASVIGDTGEIQCNDQCVLKVNGIGVQGQSMQPFPAPVALHFDPNAASTPTTTRPATTTTTPASTTVPPTTVASTIVTDTVPPGSDPSVDDAPGTGSIATSTVPSPG